MRQYTVTANLLYVNLSSNADVSVLQVVKDGSTTALKYDQNGSAQAIFVDGQWMLRNKFQMPVWVYGQRSELIYQKDGIVFWIVGDQRDDINQKTLLNIAGSLRSLHLITLFPWVARIVPTR